MKLVNWGLLFSALIFASSAAAAEDILVSQVSTFSGPQAVTGKAMHAGAKLYLDHINSQGGVKGRRIKLEAHDDGGKPEDTVRLVRESAAQNEPVAFLLTVGTANLEAVAKDGVLAKTRMFMFGPVSGATSISKVPSFMTTKASYGEEAARLLHQLSNLGIDRVGVVYQEDGYGKDVLSGIEAAAEQHGVKVVTRSGYERNTVKVETAVEQMLKAAPPVIILAAVTAPASEFFKQYRARGGAAMIYGVSVVDTQALIARIGADAARGFAFSQVMPNKSSFAIVREYEGLKAKAGAIEGLSARSIEGFIAAKLLVEVLRQSDRPTREALAHTLQRMRKVDLSDYVLDYSRSGKPASNFVDFAMISENGRVVQ